MGSGLEVVFGQEEAVPPAGRVHVPRHHLIGMKSGKV
jgi:hypothetical protein